MARILLVDQILADRNRIKAHLEGSGAAVEVASSGAEALRKLSRDRSDAVVSAARMSGMDGRALAREVRRRFPEVPVILLADQDGEELVVEALRSDAVSYVPRSHFSRGLRATVNEAVAKALTNRWDPRALNRLEQSRFSCRMGNDPTLIPPLVDLARGLVGGVLRFDATASVRLGVALEEALLNALYHGNLELSAADLQQTTKNLLLLDAVPQAVQRRKQSPFAQRTVELVVAVGKQEVRLVVIDEGPGFDHLDVARKSLTRGLDRASGRGLRLIYALVDDVQFNSRGNEIRLIMRLRPKQAPHLKSDALRLFDVDWTADTLIIIPRQSISSLVDARIQRELRYILQALRHSGVKNVVIDFQRVKYFGSSMLEAMRLVALQVHSSRGKLAACNMSRVAREILRLAKFSEQWPVGESRRQAIELVRESLSGK